MYHCHLHVYLLGRQCRIFEMIKEMPPLEHFTHEFLESSAVEEHLAKKADVIIAAPGERAIYRQYRSSGGPRGRMRR